MTKLLPAILAFVLLPVFGAFAAPVELATEAEKVSYSVGYQVGGDFQRQGWELNPEALVEGLRDAINKGAPRLSPDEMKTTLLNLKKKLVAEQQVTAKQENAAFLAENAKKAGVVVLPSGVQYLVIKEGSGKRPTLKDSVTIKYRLGRIKGKELVTDNQASDPKSYPLNQVLPGLQEVLPLMGEGATWQIVLPPGPAMGPKGEALENAGVLVYDLELISVQPAM
ncbi:MAG: peptidylprolyl isomerase [Desulfuromonas sp.]|nr:peptidylprolyl isomerase [Desulfuromonas sp.]